MILRSRTQLRLQTGECWRQFSSSTVNFNGVVGQGVMPVYAHNDYTVQLPEKHRFPMERYKLVQTRLEELLISNPSTLKIDYNPPLAKQQEIESAHEPSFVDDFIHGRLDERAIRTIGFPWSKELVQRTLRITGATVAATRAVLDGKNGVNVAGNLAGGTHHAFRSHGEGFCIFNDIAVAAKLAQQHHASQRCLVIDLDVHQGNGTAEIFDLDDSVFTFSLHAEKNYPWKSRWPSDLDIGVPDDVTDSEYIDALTTGLRRLEEKINMNASVENPLVFYQAGTDPLKEDRLGRLSLGRETLQRRNALVYEWCRRHGLKVVITMGGGYSTPIQHSVESHCDVFLQAAEMLS
mmetsp:Transcript_5903/g.7018  ORF Transcript_5903/g.7018 Transcript_5903/m.7018 type:complete len:349 (+) Transcript_5903:154-1200(+)|eukprot:CAMPEP_0204829150 /NCGR_PEP_ID=MMETSP1346-20131115/7198_1 /ASSEMBLY_ACC=CAM_ASM_000771 /TAXON_ID=215587 /ORGANISM="Aplanochytrium stocchinoi, Strain GSBS06" /LENGTH=348 /DNA_ID=CAMNT_0051958705 /DNA_START=79 /DNA_END=1125 /DNA_ORIENTATION=+